MKISYGKVLLYHFLLSMCGLVVGLIIFGAPLVKLIMDTIDLFANYGYLTTSDEMIEFFKLIFTAMAYSIGIALVKSVFTIGLSYLPYLHKTNNLNFKSIFILGIKKFFALFLLQLLIGLILFVISMLISFIPFIGAVASFGIGYLAGLAFFTLDYHVSRNALRGQSVLKHLSRNMTQLFKSTRKEHGVFIVPIFYMLTNFVGLASLFIRPLMQQRIIDILNEEEQAFYQAPPPYINPPYPPQQLG